MYNKILSIIRHNSDIARFFLILHLLYFTPEEKIHGVLLHLKKEKKNENEKY